MTTASAHAIAAPVSHYAPPRSAFTVAQFCSEHGIGRTRYFALQKEGQGPRTYKLGPRTYISAEAAAEWRAQMEKRSAETERAGVKPAPAKPFTLKRVPKS
jgi:hypothetical protein